MSMTPEQFSEWRARMGWSQEEASRRLGLGENQAGLIERRKAKLTLTIELACEALETRKQKEVAA